MVAAPELAQRRRPRAPVPDLLRPRPTCRRRSRSGSTRATPGSQPMRDRFQRARDRMTEGLARRRLHRARRRRDLFPVRRPRRLRHCARRRELRRGRRRAGRRRGRPAVRFCRAGPAAPPRAAVLRQEGRDDRRRGRRDGARRGSCSREPGRRSRRSCSTCSESTCGGQARQPSRRSTASRSGG